MLGLVLLSLIASIDPPRPSMAVQCQDVARSISGCPRYVLGLSPCEQAHRCMCEAVFPE